MTYSSHSYDEDRYVDSTDDHTLRASDGDFLDQRSPPTSRHGTNGDDTGDVFMKIASEEAARHSAADNAHDTKSTSVSEGNLPEIQRKERGKAEAGPIFCLSLVSHVWARPAFLCFYLLGLD
jgi:hypothetical protein